MIVTRFGWLAWAAMLVIVLSGVSNLFQVGVDTPLNWASANDFRYGRIFAEKMVFVGIAVVLTAVHTFVVGPASCASRADGGRSAEPRASAASRSQSAPSRCSPASSPSSWARSSPTTNTLSSRIERLPRRNHVLHALQIPLARGVAGAGAAHHLRIRARRSRPPPRLRRHLRSPSQRRGLASNAGGDMPDPAHVKRLLRDRIAPDRKIGHD